jgi:hypothetical protein
VVDVDAQEELCNTTPEEEMIKDMMVASCNAVADELKTNLKQTEPAKAK